MRYGSIDRDLLLIGLNVRELEHYDPNSRSDKRLWAYWEDGI